MKKSNSKESYLQLIQEKLKGHSLKEMRNFYTFVVAFDELKSSNQDNINLVLDQNKEIGLLAQKQNISEQDVANSLGIKNINSY